MVGLFDRHCMRMHAVQNLECIKCISNKPTIEWSALVIQCNRWTQTQSYPVQPLHLLVACLLHLFGPDICHVLSFAC